MAVPASVPIHRLTFEDVLAMVEAGILDEDDRIELEGGVLVEMMPIEEPHDRRVQWFTYHFVRSAPDDVVVRVQSGFRIPDGGYYEPDLIVFRPVEGEQPRTALLIVEVAISSYARDVEKAATYAAAGVTEYWIVDVNARQVIVHTEPGPAGYGAVRAAGPSERLLPAFGDVDAAVSDMLDA